MIGVVGYFDIIDPALVGRLCTRTEVLALRRAELIDEGIWGTVVRKLNSWKAPGRDYHCGFWWKQFSQAAELLSQAIHWMLVECGYTDNIPSWLVKGRTVLIPKEGCHGRPEQYRLITCLNTAYKLMTTVMTEVPYKHVMTYSDLPNKQQAICRGYRGCLDALMIDSMIAKEASVRKRDLSVA